ncbi:MAG: methyltransferase domain-containing protein [Solirubrobacteraceae bacterium]
MQEYRAIARRIRTDGPSRILDWGCGYGQVAALMCQLGLDVTLFDYRPEEEEGLTPLERYPTLRAHVSRDPRRLPFADQAFDAVLSCGVLEHVEDPDASLDEIRRVLVSGGTFYVYKLPNRASYLEAVARRMGLYYHGALPHDRVYNRATAVALLTRHGFVIDEFRRMNMLPLTVTSAAAERAARGFWAANCALSAIPGLNVFATNLEFVAHVR